MMQKKYVWTFVAAALGVCCGKDSRGEDVCYKKPEIGQGRDVVKGWSYNSHLDKCYVLYHAKKETYGDDNIFQSESACNKKCRQNVPEKCYARLATSSSSLDLPFATYDPNSGRCVKTNALKGKGQTPNLFYRVRSCEKQCRNTDLRLCVNATEEDCADDDRKRSYRYNVKKQTCERTTDGSCGGFRSAKECFRRCGILVDNKCTLPIQNITTCENPTTRYGYNNVTQQCEELLGCADGGNSFESAKECWESCTPTTHRCRMKPDTEEVWWFGIFKRYYFDIEKNVCEWTKRQSHEVSGTTNLFRVPKDCQKICKDGGA